MDHHTAKIDSRQSRLRAFTGQCGLNPVTKSRKSWRKGGASSAGPGAEFEVIAWKDLTLSDYGG